MTKKEFKEQCYFQVFTGRGVRINAIYLDWKADDNGRGYKYACATDTKNCTKAELFDHFYKWITNNVYLPYYVYSRFAQYDKQRFKVPLTFNPQTWN